jgi:hypothetical protein
MMRWVAADAPELHRINLAPERVDLRAELDRFASRIGKIQLSHEATRFA